MSTTKVDTYVPFPHEVQDLHEARNSLSKVVAHLQKCNNGESQCYKLLVEAQDLLRTKTPKDQSEDVMDKLTQALTAVSTLQPMYIPPSPWDVPMPKMVMKPVNSNKTSKSSTTRKLTVLTPIKPKKPVNFDLSELKYDVTLYIQAVIYYVNCMNPAPMLPRQAIPPTKAQLRLMRACLDAREALF